MPVRPLRPDDLPGLHSLFRDLTAPLPHQAAPTLAEFAQAFGEKPPHLRDSLVLVAEAAGSLRGFLRVGRCHPTPGRWTLAAAGEGTLFGPFVRPEHTAAGAELLDAALQYTRTCGIPLAYAFDPGEGVGTPFYNSGWSGLSERLPQIVRLLTERGFQVRARELCLSRSALPLPEPQSSPPSFHLATERHAPNKHSLRLYEGTFYAGACHYSPLHPSRSANEAAASIGYIDGLGVPEAYQGRGFGRLLLVQALHGLAALGCHEVWLTTNSDNFRAQNLYFSVGFALVDSALTLSVPRRIV